MNTILKADSTFDSSAHNLVYVKLYINKCNGTGILPEQLEGTGL